jgi:hypothetical protein
MPTTFEDRLLTELISEANSPSVPAVRAPMSRKILPIAAATALLGAGGLTLASQGGNGTGLAKRPSVTHLIKPTVNLTDANAILAATTAAMDQNAYAHVVSKDTSPGQPVYDTEMWVLPDGYVRRFKDTENGVLKYDTGFPADHDRGTARRVDYVTKTYEEHPADWYRIMTLTDFRTQLDNGEFAVVGQETLGDRSVTHLRETRPGVNSDVWVDSSTFLPIKSTFSSDIMTDSRDWTWVPKADANESDFMPPIPDGFTKVD